MLPVSGEVLTTLSRLRRENECLGSRWRDHDPVLIPMCENHFIHCRKLLFAAQRGFLVSSSDPGFITIIFIYFMRMSSCHSSTYHAAHVGRSTDSKYNSDYMLCNWGQHWFRKAAVTSEHTFTHAAWTYLLIYLAAMQVLNFMSTKIHWVDMERLCNYWRKLE